MLPFGPLFPDEAEKALEIFKSLRAVDVAGKPTFGECCEEWVFDFVRAIFGAYDPATGRRLIREFFLLISKKNGKSTIAAGIMITALVMNWRELAELLILSPTLEIANNSFVPAAGMVRADEQLSKLLHIQEHLRTITHRITKATLKVVAADTDTVGGKKAAFILIDELWIFGKRPNADAMFAEATGGLISRPEGFVIYLSTQSDDPPVGVFKEKLSEFRDIRDGKLDNRRKLALIFEFPAAMIKNKDHLKPENFYIANPNIGRSVDADFLLESLEDAQRGGPAKLAIFLAKHLNIEIGAGTRADRWVGADFWLGRDAKLINNVDTDLTLDEVLGRSEVVVVGIDGGGLDDLLGLVVLGRERGTGIWLLWAHAWAHEIVLERRKSEETRFRDFQKDDDLTIVGLPGEDVVEVAEIVMRIDALGLLPERHAVGVDEIGVKEILRTLDELEFDISEDSQRVVGISQGYRLMPAIKETERGLAAGRIKHAGRAMMAWAVGNAKVEPKGNAIMVTKAVSGTAKIDPLMAAFNAVFLMAAQPTAVGRSYMATADEIVVLD